VDSFDSYPELVNFVQVVSEGSGVSHFIVHARKCLLKGLNPHQNRTIPPLRYEWVWALKRDFPHLDFSLNGGVLRLEEVVAALTIVNSGTIKCDSHDTAGTCNDNRSTTQHREGLQGVMVGRAAYNMPWDVLGASAQRCCIAHQAVWCKDTQCQVVVYYVVSCRKCRLRSFWSCKRSHKPSPSSQGLRCLG
jgi:tRNA-dihydrouridine synthase